MRETRRIRYIENTLRIPRSDSCPLSPRFGTPRRTIHQQLVKNQCRRLRPCPPSVPGRQNPQNSRPRQRRGCGHLQLHGRDRRALSGLSLDRRTRR
jgi:hypothetical protein